MQKHKINSDVQNFAFGNLSGATTHKDESYIFKNLSDVKSADRDAKHQEIIRSEREHEAKSDFKIDQIVRDLRGLSAQEQNELERKISTEVNKRMIQLSEKAYKEGLEKGRLEGVDVALKEAYQHHQTQIDEFQKMIETVQTSTSGILSQNKNQTYLMLKRVLKWLVLKEINDDSYLAALLEKLILELNQKQNLIVRVRKESFNKMPEVVKQIEEKLGKLSNLRVEIDMNQQHAGIILETENGIIDGSIEALFQTLDKMFEEVIQHEN